MTSNIGKSVHLPHPGHACSRFSEAVVLEENVGPDKCMLLLLFPNGLKAYCQPDRVVFKEQ